MNAFEHAPIGEFLVKMANVMLFRPPTLYSGIAFLCVAAVVVSFSYFYAATKRIKRDSGNSGHG